MTLAAVFVEHAEHSTELVDLAVLDASLHQVLSAARTRWPDVAFRDDFVVEGLAACWASDDAAPQTVEHPPFVVELILAQACLRGEVSALRVLRREMFVRAERVLARLRLDAADVDDVRQEVATRLLVGDRPKLAQYEGSGPLSHWIASVVGREGLLMLRRRRLADPSGTEALLDDDDDPELAVLNRRHGADFKRAFQAAVAELSPRDRTVLRALLVDDRSVNDIAALYKIHRVTASRWLSEIRQRLLRDTRARLQQTLQLDASSVDSAIRIVASELDLSLYRLLAAR